MNKYICKNHCNIDRNEPVKFGVNSAELAVFDRGKQLLKSCIVIEP